MDYMDRDVRCPRKDVKLDHWLPKTAKSTSTLHHDKVNGKYTTIFRVGIFISMWMCRRQLIT